MKFLVIVNESPWRSVLASSAFRFAGAAAESHHTVDAVFFREDGVYNALPGQGHDAGSVDLFEGWKSLAENGTRLLVCASSWQRRAAASPLEPFEDTGLAALLEQMDLCDRVVTF